MCQFTIDVVALSTSDRVELLGGRELAHVFDVDLLLPLASVSLGTGVLRAVRSKWGLVRHWWVFVKLVVTCGLMVGIRCSSGRGTRPRSSLIPARLAVVVAFFLVFLVFLVF